MFEFLFAMSCLESENEEEARRTDRKVADECSWESWNDDQNDYNEYMFDDQQGWRFDDDF